MDKLYEDMYIGKGKGNEPMTTRVSLLEQSYESVCSRLEKIEKSQNKMLMASIATLVALLSEIVVRLLFK